MIAKEFGFEVPVVVRTRDELAAVVKRNPLGKVATEPKRYQVSFLDRKPDAKLVKELKSLAADSEEFAANGREFYAWHPDGVARSKLWNKLAGKGLGVTATARNWTTVTTLLEMADEELVHRYEVVDVFTDTPLQGNPVAVFTGAAGLSAEVMQSAAREMNLSESVFVVDGRSDPGGYDAHIRIFTPATELPFAGHPVLGTAFVIGEAQRLALVRLKTAAGVIPVALSRERDRIVYGEMEQPIPEFEPFDRADEVLAAVGVERSELPVMACRNGPVHVYVALASEDAVAALDPDLTALRKLRGRRRELLCRARRTVQDAHVRPGRWRARGPGDRIGRRPARRPPRAPRLERVRPADPDPPGRGDRQALGDPRPCRRIRRADRAGRGRWRGRRCCPRRVSTRLGWPRWI